MSYLPEFAIFCAVRRVVRMASSVSRYSEIFSASTLIFPFNTEFSLYSSLKSAVSSSRKSSTSFMLYPPIRDLEKPCSATSCGVSMDNPPLLSAL